MVARWRRRIRAAGIALALAFVVVVASSSGSDTLSGRLGGDFPSFYAAGDLVLDEPGSLYDPVAQTDRQRELFAGETDGFLYFAYPPYVAVAYAAVAQVPYALAYALVTLVMVGFVVGGLWLLRPLVPVLDRYFPEAAILALLFYPMLRAVTAGQTTGFVFFVLAIGIRALAGRHDLVAGLAFACLLFKPQYALALIGVSLLIRRWRVLAASAGGAIGLWLVGVVVQGWGWLGPWVEQVRWFTEIDAEVNATNAISWLGAAEAVFGVGAPSALLIGWGLAAATVALVAWTWWADRGRHLPDLVAVTVPALLLMAPHAMFYDAGLLVVTLAVLVGPRPAHGRALVLVFAVALTQPFAPDLGIAPTFFVTVGVFVWAVVDRRERVLTVPDRSSATSTVAVT